METTKTLSLYPLLPALTALLLAAGTQAAHAECPAAQAKPLVPTSPARCAALAAEVRDPGALPLDQYEARLAEYLTLWCHRDTAAGWVRDKRIRDTGPFIATRQGGKDGQWSGSSYSTHGAVVIWYSPEMVRWLEQNRPLEPASGDGGRPRVPVPDGAMMIKEMYPSPATRCAEVPPERLLPPNGAAVMIRDNQAAHDGWFWGWFGWSGWGPDWPAPATNRLPNMGFGQYCVNCHASAADNLTFSDLKNLQGYGGQPNVFLVQDWFAQPQLTVEPHHVLVRQDADDSLPVDQSGTQPNPAILALPGASEGLDGVGLGEIEVASIALPSQT